TLLERMERNAPRAGELVLARLAQSCSAVAKLAAKEDVKRCSDLLARGLLAAGRRGNEEEKLHLLIEGLRGLAGLLSVEESRELTGVLATGLIRLDESREEDQEFLVSLLSEQQAVDFLKHPTCGEGMQAVILSRLGVEVRERATLREVRDRLLER